MKIIDANENIFLKNYLKDNKKECFDHNKNDKILVNLTMKILYLFCNNQYFDLLEGEISHLTHNLDKNYDKNYDTNLDYSKKLKIIEWNFFKKPYKFSNYVNSFFLGNHIRTAIPVYDNYIYLMKLSSNFYLDINGIYFRMNLINLTKINYYKGFEWSKNAHLGYDSCTFILTTVCGKPKTVFKHLIYILYLKISSHKTEFVFYIIPFLYTFSHQALNYWYITTYFLSFIMSMESTMCKTINFLYHE